MLKVTVSGLPARLRNTPELRDLLINQIPEAIKACDHVPGVRLDAGEIYCFAPADLLDEGLGEEILVDVIGGNPSITRWLGNLSLAVTVCVARFAERHVPECKRVATWAPRFAYGEEGFHCQSLNGCSTASPQVD